MLTCLLWVCVSSEPHAAVLKWLEEELITDKPALVIAVLRRYGITKPPHFLDNKHASNDICACLDKNGDKQFIASFEELEKSVEGVNYNDFHIIN